MTQDAAAARYEWIQPLLSLIPTAASTGFVASTISSHTLRYWIFGSTIAFAAIGWRYGVSFREGASRQRRRARFLLWFGPGLILTILTSFLITWTNPETVGTSGWAQFISDRLVVMTPGADILIAALWGIAMGLMVAGIAVL